METLRKTPVSIKNTTYGIWGFSSMHAKGFTMPMENDPFYELFFIRQGHGICKTKDGDIDLKPNSLLLIEPQQAHQLIDSNKSPLSLYGVCFSPDLVDTDNIIKIFQHKLKTTTLLNNSYAIRLVTESIREIIFEQTERAFGYQSKIQHTLFNMLIDLLRSLTQIVFNDDDPIESSLLYIEQNFYKHLKISELAEDCGLSTRRFTELFKRKTGNTCIKYINEKRLNYAKKRLQNQGDINMVMLDSGFGDISHFYKLFKQHTGLTPKQFLDKAKSIEYNF